MRYKRQIEKIILKYKEDRFAFSIGGVQKNRFPIKESGSFHYS